MTGWYLYSIICELTGLCLYLYGFFLVNYEDGQISSQSSSVPINDVPIKNSRHISKTVLMIIDAMRYDFVTSNDTRFNMPYLSSLMEKNEACVFPCRVHLPTVTMPRIKAMTVGSISNFLDVALNFGSKQIKHDNIIAQMRRNGMKIVFYGDDTWIKLFPNSFYRQEGVTSFFVSDFYEVDNIVTKNVERELSLNDWDVMILHYLGLDHIGHVEGSRSPRISGKLQNMDTVIKMLNEHLVRWKQNTNENYLLVVCADHGMRNSGGHGGSSFHEVLVPLVTVGINCPTKNEISQVDLAVTLSSLMGLPIPQESVGKVIPEFLLHLSPSEKVDIYRQVTKHLMKKYIEIVGPISSDMERSFENAHKLTLENTEEACHEFQSLSDRLSSSVVAFLTKFDIFLLFVGIIITIQASCLPLTSNKAKLNALLKSLPMLGLIILLFSVISYLYRCQSTIFCSLSKDNFIVICLITSVVCFNTVHLFQTRKLMLGRLLTAITIAENDGLLAFLITGLCMQILTMLSTSLIEEEHMFWYFLWTSWLLLVLCQQYTKRLASFLVGLLISHRILKKLNQTGDQYASLPDIGDWLRVPERQLHLTIFLVFELMCTLWVMYHRRQIVDIEKSKRTIVDLILSIDKYTDLMCVTLVFLYRAAVGDVSFGKIFFSDGGLLEFRIFKYFLAASTFVKLIKCWQMRKKTLQWSFIDVSIEVWVLITILLMRPHNVVLPAALIITSKWLNEAIATGENKEVKIIVTHHWLAYVYFFYQGNSNSLATIDVTAGYIGQSEYNAVVAGTLIIMSTYAMPVLAYMLMLKEIQTLRRNAVEPALRLLLMFVNAHVAIYLIVVTLQRYHLFIWSVFSPKLFYLSAYCLILYPVIVVAIWLSGKK